MTCANCGKPLTGRLNSQRKWCGSDCRSRVNYLRRPPRNRGKQVKPVEQETPRERYLRQCAETSWESY